VQQEQWGKEVREEKEGREESTANVVSKVEKVNKR
jgi:hypothetical protein